ncbi:MAG: hypothetical protein ACI4SB_10300, partial [Acutalibacteraceae bacterium]
REIVTMLVDYDDNNGNHETVTYTFNIIKYDKTSDSSTAQNDIVANIQNQVSTVIPQGNETANKIVNEIFDAVDNQITPPTTEKTEEYITEYSDAIENSLSTYAFSTDSESSTMNPGADFDYLNQLFNETYPSDDAAYSALTTEQKSDESVAQRAAEAVKENPEIVAAPTSILAVGVLAGYMFNVRKKSAESGVIGDEDNSENGED